MSFMDKMLEKSEQKLFTEVISGLKLLDDSLEYSIEQVTCSEDQSFTHLALRVHIPDHKLYFHRCRNDWYFSEEATGRNCMLLSVDQWNRNLAIRQLHLMISSVQSELEKSIEPDSSEQVSEDEPKYEAESVRVWLLELMVRSGCGLESSTTFADELAIEWKTESEKALKLGSNDSIGTLWAEGIETKNKRASKAVQGIVDTETKLLQDGVTKQQVVTYWNMPLEKQNLLKAQNKALLHSQIQVRLEHMDQSEEKNRAYLAYKQALCSVAVFGQADANDDGKVLIHSPIPWELSFKVYDFFLHQNRTNPSWLVEAIECRTFNSYYRLKNPVDPSTSNKFR